MFEIELKFPVEEHAPIAARLTELGATRGGPVEQTDAYFNHPARDFAATDEALRIRTVGGASVVTYKGPREPGLAKTRRELETPLAEGTAEAWGALLRTLGFRPVATVRKRRTPYALTRGGSAMEVALDEVEGLGAYVEIETLAEPADRDAAEREVANLAEELGVSGAEPRSYLEMVLTRPG